MIMANEKNILIFTGEGSATVYFYAKKNTCIGFISDTPLDYRLSDAFDEELTSGHGAELSYVTDGACGNFRLVFLRSQCAAEIKLVFDDSAVPYIMPGVGVLWEHGGVFPLLLSKKCPHNLWMISDERDVTEPVAVIKGVDYGEDVRITSDRGEYTADWYPKMSRPWFWNTAKLPKEKIIRFDIPAASADVRFTVYDRNVMALVPPKGHLPLGELRVNVTDESGNDIDSRIEVFVGDERVAMSDSMANERHPIYLPQGRYRVRASHGMFFGEAETVVDLCEKVAEITLVLTETVKLPDGWFAGELHTHSSLEDATLFPRQVMAAARACGRHFCFMTDKNVEQLESFGLRDFDKYGRFLSIPGQEIMCHELHTNLLNPSKTVKNPEAEDLTSVNPDIEEKIEGWLRQYRSMKKDRPCLIIHNHPTHRAEVAKRGKPYFRSWWVSDMFSCDYHLVENCGYEGWFDRLNRGHRLYAAWTGDGHDCTLMYPGKEGVCVYTGGELTPGAVIKALEEGRFFSCRAPGCFAHINKTSEQKLHIAVTASVPIERIELISDGKLAGTFSLEGRLEADIYTDIPENARWCMARVKLSKGDWNPKLHSFTPFMEDGFAAFTNPLFFD